MDRYEVSPWWAGALIVGFALHNSEEVVANDARMAGIGGDGLAERLHDLYRTDRFIVAVVVLTCVVIAALVPVVVRRTAASERLALLATGALIANGLTHIGQTVVLRGYNLGLVTAVAIMLPLAVTMAVLIHRRSDRSRWQTAVVLLVGAILSIPAIIGALALSVVVVR